MSSSPNKGQIIQDFANKRSSYFHANYETERPGNYLRRLRRSLIVDAVLDQATDAAVCDAGCGPAILYPEILERCATYLALDLTPTNLEEIREAHQSQKLECVCADLDAFKWPQNAYDVIVCSGAIEYTDQPQHNLVSMAAALKPGGSLVCSFPSRRSPYSLWGKYFYTPLSQAAHQLRGDKVSRYKRALFAPEATRQLLQAYLPDVRLTYFGYKFLMQPLDKLFSSWDHAVTLRLQARPIGLLTTYASEFLIVARRAK